MTVWKKLKEEEKIIQSNEKWMNSVEIVSRPKYKVSQQLERKRLYEKCPWMKKYQTVRG